MGPDYRVFSKVCIQRILGEILASFPTLPGTSRRFEITFLTSSHRICNSGLGLIHSIIKQWQ